MILCYVLSLIFPCGDARRCSSVSGSFGMDSPMDALELLLTMDNRRAVQLAQLLDSHNRKR